MEYIGQNYLPYFDPSLSAFIQIYKQEMEQVWEFALPSYFDSNINDSVSLSVSMVEVEAFMSFDEKKAVFEIENLADPDVPTGTFRVTVTLSDGTEDREFPISLVIYGVGDIAGEPELDDSQVDEEDQTLDEEDLAAETTTDTDSGD